MDKPPVAPERDTIGTWGDANNVGNGYAFVGNNPWTYVDPLGEHEREGGKTVYYVPVFDPKTGRPILDPQTGEQVHARAVGADQLRDAEKDKYMRPGVQTRYYGNPKNPKSPRAKQLRVKVKTNDGRFVEVWIRQRNELLEFETDCHGQTFLDGEAWMNNDQVPDYTSGDGYVEVRDGEAKPGDVVIYTHPTKHDIEHSMTVTKVDKDGKPIEVRGLGGLEKDPYKTTPEGAWPDKKEHRQVFRVPEEKASPPASQPQSGGGKPSP